MNDETTKPLITQIKEAVNGLITLTITTQVTTSGDKSMKTEIKLLEGDITNTMHQAFVGEDLTKLRGFHEAQVVIGQQIIKDNIEATKSLMSLLKNNEELNSED